MPTDVYRSGDNCPVDELIVMPRGVHQYLAHWGVYWVFSYRSHFCREEIFNQEDTFPPQLSLKRIVSQYL